MMEIGSWLRFWVRGMFVAFFVCLAPLAPAETGASLSKGSVFKDSISGSKESMPDEPALPSEREMALNYYQPLAEQGVPYAQLTIGELYLQGSGVDFDPVHAYAWLYTALFQGVPEARPLMEEAYQAMDEPQRTRAQELAADYARLHTPKGR